LVSDGSYVSMTIEAVIFDYGGVFVHSPVLCFAKFEQKYGLPHRYIGGVIKKNLHGGAFAKFERSEINVTEFDHLFAEETRGEGFEVTGRQLLSMLYKLDFHENMIIALEKVQTAGLKTGCITNNMPGDAMGWDIDESYRERTLSVLQKFDHLIESSKVGVRKPEPRIYEMMCEALHVEPGTCVFLDDLGVNLKPARDMGMKTVKVPLDDVQPAIEELAALTGLSL